MSKINELQKRVEHLETEVELLKELVKLQNKQLVKLQNKRQETVFDWEGEE